MHRRRDRPEGYWQIRRLTRCLPDGLRSWKSSVRHGACATRELIPEQGPISAMNTRAGHRPWASSMMGAENSERRRRAPSRERSETKLTEGRRTLPQAPLARQLSPPCISTFLNTLPIFRNLPGKQEASTLAGSGRALDAASQTSCHGSAGRRHAGRHRLDCGPARQVRPRTVRVQSAARRAARTASRSSR